MAKEVWLWENEADIFQWYKKNNQVRLGNSKCKNMGSLIFITSRRPKRIMCTRGTHCFLHWRRGFRLHTSRSIRGVHRRLVGSLLHMGKQTIQGLGNSRLRTALAICYPGFARGSIVQKSVVVFCFLGVEGACMLPSMVFP